MSSKIERTVVCLGCGRVIKAAPELLFILGWKEFQGKEGSFFLCGACLVSRDIEGLSYVRTA